MKVTFSKLSVELEPVTSIPSMHLCKESKIWNTEMLCSGAGNWEREILPEVEIQETTYNSLKDLSFVHTSGTPFWSLL